MQKAYLRSSAYNVICRVTFNLNSFKILNTQSQSITTRPRLGLTFENATTLIRTMAGLRAALPNFLLLRHSEYYRQNYFHRIHLE